MESKGRFIERNNNKTKEAKARNRNMEIIIKSKYNNKKNENNLLFIK